MTAPFVQSDRYETSGSGVIAADVLVIGGSIAGAWAALTARRHGAKVVLAEKGFVGTSGVVAAATGGGLHTVPGDEEASRKVVESHHAVAEGLDDLAFIRKVYDETYRVGMRLAEMGFDSTRGGGPPVRRLTSFRGPYSLNFLREQLLKAGVVILDHSPALELLSADGTISGAAGVNRQTGARWTVVAGAVILATGGNAFRSGAIGTNSQTGDGHLMASEAGASLAGMEFSGHYGIVPANSSITKGFWYSSATFWDGRGRELPRNGWQSVPDVAEAILETGRVWAQMDKGGPDFEANARKASPNIWLYFDRLGLDPVRNRFPVDLVLEGTVRATGGLCVNHAGHTGVPGLWASGDVTERLRMTGSALSGAGPAISWCLASGEWSGEAAARFALERGVPPGTLLGLGGIGLRPKSGSIAPQATAAAATAEAKAEITPLDKNAFRTTAGMRTSLTKLDRAYAEAKDGLAGRDARDAVAAREAAALIQGVRWIYNSALARTETRGLHRRREFPASDPAQTDRVEVSGLDEVSVRRVPLAGNP